ncbi:MAG TPA: GntR family transcriptional regulator [Pseudonocardia sp.]|jgi:DNA-binding FadR family transcriptional regulator
MAERWSGRPLGLSERLTLGLVELIAEQRLSPGDVLPTVRELAARFSVTAPTVREALRRLEATDAVRMRHGSGVYVGPGINRMLLANPTPTPMRDEAVLDMVAARLTIEPGIAALAALHRTEDQLAQLERATRTALTEPGEPGQRPNFHRELARCSGNQVLYEVIDSLLRARRDDQRAVRLLIADRGRDHREHLAIFGAVRDRDQGAAERLTRDHLNQLYQSVAARLGRTLK